MALNLALNLEKKYIRVYGFESLAINTHLKQSLHMIERTIYQGLHICNWYIIQYALSGKCFVLYKSINRLSPTVPLSANKVSVTTMNNNMDGYLPQLLDQLV